MLECDVISDVITCLQEEVDGVTLRERRLDNLRLLLKDLNEQVPDCLALPFRLGDTIQTLEEALRRL